VDNLTDNDLITRFLDGDRQNAFRALVEKHSAMIYGCARRIVGDHETAQDVTQAVFILLSRKAPDLKNHRSITGWLYRCASLVSRDALKLSRRRAARERDSLVAEPDADRWAEIAVHLDSSMNRLSENDRHAILLRFFENQSLKDVGRALGISEDTAQKRISRALEQLRKLLLLKGVALSATTLASSVSANASSSMPLATPALLSASALTTSKASVSVNAILKASATTMFMSKIKTAAIVTMSALLFAGGATTVINRYEQSKILSGRFSGASPLQILADLSEAARTHDGGRMSGFVHITKPDLRDRLRSLTDLISAVGRFDRACRKAFGDSSTDLALWDVTPRLLYRLEFGQENLTTASVQLIGNEAKVNIKRDNNAWQYLRFQKIDGAWKIHEEAIDDIVSPADAIKYSKLAPILNAFTQDVEAGRFSSAKMVMEQFAQKVNDIESAQ
jgi:RNA polymerase sigma factor (sigma-70 family)